MPKARLAYRNCMRLMAPMNRVYVDERAWARDNRAYGSVLVANVRVTWRSEAESSPLGLCTGGVRTRQVR